LVNRKVLVKVRLNQRTVRRNVEEMLSLLNAEKPPEWFRFYCHSDNEI
jgi:hypothetical protein